MCCVSVPQQRLEDRQKEQTEREKVVATLHDKRDLRKQVDDSDRTALGVRWIHFTSY